MSIFLDKVIVATDSIQLAINSLPSTGGTVLVPSGTWQEYNIHIPSNVYVVGEGMSTIVKVPDTAPNSVNVFNMGGSTNSRISNLYIDGNGQRTLPDDSTVTEGDGINLNINSVGTAVAGASDIWIDNVYLKDITASGIIVTGANNVMVDSIRVDTTYNSVGIGGSPATDITVQNSIMNNTFASAYQICGFEDLPGTDYNFRITYSNCIAYDCGVLDSPGGPAAGFDLTRTQSSSCVGCVAYNCFGAGFNIEFTANLSSFVGCIADNNCRQPDAGGNFNMGGSKEGLVVDSCIIANGQSSLDVASFPAGFLLAQPGGGYNREISITNNLIVDNLGDGLYLQGPAQVLNNVIVNNELNGIQMTGGQAGGTNIAYNFFSEVSDSSSKCINVASSDVTIQSNTFKDNSAQFGILSDTYDRLVVSNNRFINTDTPLRVTRAEDCRLDSNYFYDCDFNNLAIAGVNYSSVSNNTFSDTANQADDVSTVLSVESFGTDHSTNNIINENIIRVTTVNQPKFGIREVDSNQSDNKFFFNIVDGIAVTEIDLNGSNREDGFNTPTTSTFTTGPTTSTDNAIARYDGTTGDIQDSGVILDDSNNLTLPDTSNIQVDQVRARDGDGLALYDDGGSGIFVQDGGNVGIGTSSPGSKLSVSLSTNEIAGFNDGLSASGIWGQSIGLVSQSAEGQISTVSGIPLTFYSGGSSNTMTTGTRRMTLDTSGNLIIEGGQLRAGSSANPATRQANLRHDNTKTLLSSNFGAVRIQPNSGAYTEIDSDSRTVNRENNGAVAILGGITYQKQISLSSSAVEGGASTVIQVADSFIIQRVIAKMNSVSLGTGATFNISAGTSANNDTTLNGNEINLLASNALTGTGQTLGDHISEAGAWLSTAGDLVFADSQTVYLNWAQTAISSGTTDATITVYVIGFLSRNNA